ncbi:xylan 1,4-beta-xylosidase [Nonomuraea sediminis]|uniref:xylan 1,4-beta-xylosidase n=1 Tax=Nonomuraea sediminis TaxID=2835864 RepID=UPI001BDD1041|nr:xylan 1,4-beta-xylosidase [Nonomuraea sediminis]
MGWHGWGSTRLRRTRTVVIATLVLAALSACSATVPEAATKAEGRTAAPARSAVAEPPPVDPNWPRWGLTHTQTSANNGDERLLEGASQTLSHVPMLQNQHIMGFGVGNPELYPGEFAFKDLDSRMRLMDRSGGLPVITLCCAPDWMKGGPAGQTSWQRDHFEAAPEPSHFDDFAKLAATIAQRYNNVQYFMVWNELKGFWPDHSKPPDIEGYTTLYNKVYEAVKAVRPDAKIGGPYLGMDSVSSADASELKGKWGAVDQVVLDAFDYWNKHKKGADFIVVDGASPTEDHAVLPDPFGATAKFGAVTRWLRKKTGNLPIWWSEWYIMPEDGQTRWPEDMRLAVQAVSMIELATSGAATALYWNPETKQGDCPGCMWNPQDGSALPTGDLISNFVKWFPAGVELRQATTSDSRIRLLAQQEKLLMVNTTGSRLTATVNGKSVTLQPYEIRWTSA